MADDTTPPNAEIVAPVSAGSPVTAAAPGPAVRYIKLGRANMWAPRAFQDCEVHFGHGRTSHEMAASADKDALTAHYVSLGHKPGKARDFAREVFDFYHLDAETIWITFVDGHLWWARAEPEVSWIGFGSDHGERVRRTIGPWRNTNARGEPLIMDQLSTRLTKVASYQQTLCEVDRLALPYLLRKIAGEEEPLVAVALEARRAVISAAEGLIAALHWADFETLVDIILARGGWHRVSALGGTLKDADLMVEQAVTGETALVQVKSAVGQGVLDDYIARFDANPTLSRLIFVCHSPRGKLDPGLRPEVMVWARETLAETVVRHGLFDWLVARAG